MLRLEGVARGDKNSMPAFHSDDTRLALFTTEGSSQGDLWFQGTLRACRSPDEASVLGCGRGEPRAGQVGRPAVNQPGQTGRWVVEHAGDFD